LPRTLPDAAPPAMENAPLDLPFRLRTLRRQHQYSLSVLALKTGLTRSYLSKLERGHSSPSLATTMRLAEAYGLSVAQLLGTGPEGLDEVVSIVRAAERQPLVRHGSALGYGYQAVTGRRRVKAMQPFVVFPPREFPARVTVHPHAGEEFMLVLKGAVEMVVGERSFRLEKDDSVYFDATLPHRMRTVSRTPAEVLVVAAR